MDRPETTAQFAIDVLEGRVGGETLVEHLLEKAESASDPVQAKEALQRLADLYENEMGDREAAFTVLQAALERDPTDRLSVRELDRLGGALGKWNDLVVIYAEAVNGLETQAPEAASEIWTRLARIYTQNLGNLEYAEHAIDMALRIDPERFDVLTVEAEIQRRRGQWVAFVETMRKLLALTRDPSVKLELLLAQGEVYEGELRDHARAVQAFEAALAIDPAVPEALSALERLYADLKQWDRHMTVLESHLAVARSTEEKIRLYRRMATVAEEFLGDVDRATRCLEAVLARDESDEDARRELERICREQGRWTDLYETYRRRLLASADPAVRVPLLRACAEILETKLDDPSAAATAWAEVSELAPDDARAHEALARLHHLMGERSAAVDDGEAEHHLLEALRLDPSSMVAMRDLAKIYRGRGEWLKAAQLLQHADEQAQNVLDKVQLRFEAARLYHEKLRDGERALPLFEGVLQLDPEHIGAGRALAEYLLRADKLKEAEPILAMLARRAAGMEMDAEEKLDVYVKAGRCADARGDAAKAREFYELAAACDATHVPALQGLAELARKDGDLAEAEKWYRAVLDRQKRNGVRGRAIAATIHALGDLRRKKGDLEAALLLFQKAYKLGGEWDTLRAMIGVHEERGDYEAAIRGKQLLVEHVDDADRVELYKSIADLHLIGRRDGNKAISALRQALLLAPRDRSLLQRYLEACTEAERWKDAAATALKIADLEEDRFKRGKYYQAAGLIHRDKLRSPSQAIAYLNLALDDFFADPEKIADEAARQGSFRTFADLERLLAGERDWRSLERQYRKMIHRLAGDDPLVPALWHNLGHIYLGRLGEVENAIKAFEVAEKLQPSPERARLVAELLERTSPHAPGGVNRAVQKRFELLQADPYNPDHYRALIKLYVDVRELDKCWCLARALVFYRRADADESRFYAERRAERAIPRDTLDAGAWRLLRHPGENSKISALLATVREAAIQLTAVPRERVAGRPASDRNLGAKAELYRRAFARFARLLGVPTPELFFRPEDAGGLVLLAIHDKGRTHPAYVIHGDHMQVHRSNVEIDHAAARALTYLRAEYVLRMLLPTRTELTTVFLSALASVRPDFAIPEPMRAAVAASAPVLARAMQPTWREQLAMVVQRLLGDGTVIDLDGWCNAVDATARRVGLVMGGDLELSARLVAVEPVLVGAPKTTDRIKDLVVFSVSEPYFTLRHRLGTTVA